MTGPSRTPAQSIGADAEAAAERHLARHGLEIVARNYRTRLGELDLVAREGEVLVFVEVRCRADARHGTPLESITPAKRRRIVAAARRFLQQLGREPRCRFDVVAVDERGPTWLRGAFDAS